MPRSVMSRSVRARRGRRRSERGAAAVEFALVVPILLMLVCGIVDFGLAINRYAMVNSAAREGVREASLGATESEIRAVVTRGAATIPGTVSITVGCKKPDEITACTSWSSGMESGGLAEVTVTSTSSWITPVGGMFAPSLSISRTTRMRIE